MLQSQCDNGSNMRMSASTNLMLRISIVLGMVAAVVTVLYFTPLPDQNFKSCDRPCHDLDWPMICRVKLTIEMYKTVNQECQDCPANSTNCNNSYCTSAEGSRGIIMANRQLPGPPIQVCQNDILVVDVTNKIPGHSLSIHWRGQSNHEAPFMDGVPMVTQCPVLSYTTFQYKFRASTPGTHFYHAHSNSDRTDGLFGALIVRQADKIEPHRRLYDVDSKDHIILLSEWSGDRSTVSEVEDELPKAILINGKAPLVSGPSLPIFKVEKNKRYRFRVAYTGGNAACPISVSVDNHLLKVITMDGNPISPLEVSSVQLSKGERLDFVLKTNQMKASYFIRASSNCNTNEIHGTAVISYGGATATTENILEKNSRSLETSLCDTEIGKVCLKNMKSLNKLVPKLQETQIEKKIYLGFDHTMGEVKIQKSLRGVRSKIYRINNFTFTYPPSPLLTQPEDVPSNLMCNELNVPQRCASQNNICECVHMEHIALGTTAEIILIDQDGDQDEHIFHLHGYQFYVVGSNTFDTPLTRSKAMQLDAEEKLIKRNLLNPVLKDTIRVPKNGVVALRFLANNPGFWMLRDEQSKGWTRGMDIVFQVGDLGDLISTPTNFPECGSFVGPDFFLL